MSEELMKVIVELVQTGGDTAIWLVVILQASSLLKFPITFLGLWVLVHAIKTAVTAWIREDKE